jgi:branched-chain amino acid transport system permease protein
MLYFLQQVLNGLHSGALYALLAFGYALTNGILHRTNLAYGGIFAFCGQTTILVAVYGWQVLWLTLPATIALGVLAAFIYAVLLGRLLAAGVFAPLAARSPNAIAAATLGVLIVLQELSRIAADTHDYWLPPMLAYPVVLAAGPNLPCCSWLACCLPAPVSAATGGQSATIRRRRRFAASTPA